MQLTAIGMGMVMVSLFALFPSSEPHAQDVSQDTYQVGELDSHEREYMLTVILE